MGWLTGWAYRKSHLITYAAGSGTLYQKKIVVHYGAGTSSGDDVYCNSHCKTDFGDIRFTDDDGTTLLDYWLEEKTDSDKAIFWVEVADDLSSADQTIYVYYGNAGVSTTSNGANTFLFFDDVFASGWSLIYGTVDSWGVTSGELWVQARDVAYHIGKSFTYDLTNNIKIICRNKPDTVNEGTYSNHKPIFLENNASSLEAWSYIIWTVTSPDNHYAEAQGVDVLICTGDVTIGTWYRTVFTYKHSTKTSKLTINDVYKGSAVHGTAPFTSIITIGIGGYRDNHRIDYIAAAKFVDPEPANSTWGDEETGGTQYYQTVSEILGLVDTVTKKAAYKQTISELLGLIDFVSTQYQAGAPPPTGFGEKPEIQIIKGPDQDITADGFSITATLRENKLWDLQLSANDELSKTYLSTLQINDTLTFKFRYADLTEQWTTIFKGKVVELQPSLDVSEGAVCQVKAYGTGLGLKRMRVAQQYGVQSTHPTLDTLPEIFTDANYGIVPKYINKILGGSMSSGYNLYSEYIWNTSASMDYFYFPDEPAIKCLEDICNIMAAKGYPIHWIVNKDGQLIIAPVGDHHVYSSEGHLIDTLWLTTYRDAAHPIVVSEDMISMNFSKKEPEANYVLINGLYEYPDNERATEGHADEWDDGGFSVWDEATIKVLGTYSLGFGGNNPTVFYPAASSSPFLLSKVSTKKELPTISFWIRKTGGTNLKVSLLKDDRYNGYLLNLDTKVNENNKWFYVTLTIGPDHDISDDWQIIGTATWDTVNKTGFVIDGSGINVFVDDLHINGYCLKGIYSSSSITANGCTIKLINESLSKTSDPNSSTCQLALIGKAELLKAKASPLTGVINIPFDPSVLPGQLCHIHAGMTETEGVYKIDQSMRITEVKDTFSKTGAITSLTLTDDLTNSYPYSPTDAYNLLIRSLAPDFQDRDHARLKAANINLELPICKEIDIG